MFNLPALWILVGLLILTSKTTTSNHCPAEPQHTGCAVQKSCLPGNIHVGVLVNVHRQDKESLCTMSIQPDAVMALEATKWIFDQLNSENYIPGVKIGLRAYDTCGREDAALGSLLRLAPEVVQPNCVVFPSVAGILGLFSSGQAIAVADSLVGTSLPLISPSATATSLNDRSKYANFFRTVSTNADHAKVMLKVAERLGWKYVAVVHGDDPYGTDGADEFVKLAKEMGICVGLKEAISSLASNDVVGRLIQLVRNTEENYLGVVFYGDNTLANWLLRKASLYLSTSEDVRRIIWLMPDSLGTDDDQMQTLPNMAEIGQNVISISPSSVEIADFKTHWTDLIYDALTGVNATVDEWIEEYLEHSFQCYSRDCYTLTKQEVLDAYRQPRYLFQVITAAYVYAKTIKDLHSSCVNNNDGDCDDATLLASGTLDAVRETDFKFWDANNPTRIPFLPAVLNNSVWDMRFDQQTGVKIQEEDRPTYSIHNFKCENGKSNCGFKQVGQYYPQKEILSMSLKDVTVVPSNGRVVTADTLKPVVCVRNCQICQTHLNNIPHVYIHGDFLLLGIFPIHHPSKIDPFECHSEIRSVGSVQLMEGFIMAINKLNESPLPGGLRWGGIALDDCYNNLKAYSVVSRFLSGEIEIKVNETLTVSADKVVAVIGGLSSAVSKMVVGITGTLHLLQVSYGATSTSLFSESNFLRTLPADDAQAKALVEIVKEMGWNSFSVIYREGPYGTSGYEAIKAHAEALKLCITHSEKVKRNPNDEKHLIKILAGMTAPQAVILFMSNEEVKEVLSVAKSIGKTFIWIGTESWADRVSVLENSTSEAWGSITLTIKTIYSTEFENYFIRLDPWTYQQNPFFTKYWETRFECKLPNSAHSSFTTQCVQGEHSLAKDYQQDTYITHVLDAVLATGQGINKVISDKEVCPNIMQCGPEQLRTETGITKIVEAVKSAELTSGSHTYHPFTVRGDGSAPYIINNVRLDGSSRGYYEEVGIYDQFQGLRMDVNETVKFYNKRNGDEIKVDSTCQSNCEACSPEDEAAELWKKQIHVTGDVLLAGLFPMHQSPRDGSMDIGDVCSEGLLMEEVFIWTIEQINKDPSLLPGSKLGYQVLDSFSDSETAAWQAAGLLGPGRYLYLRDSHIDPSSILGFVTGSDNDVTLAIQRVTSRHQLVQIDYKSTLDENSSTYFVRKSPSAEAELDMLAKVLSDAGWSEVSVIFSVNIWGEDGENFVTQTLNNHDMCIDTFFPVSEVTGSDIYAIKSNIKSRSEDTHPHMVLLLLKDYQTKTLIESLPLDYGNIIFAGGTNFVEGIKDLRGLNIEWVDKAIGVTPSLTSLDEDLLAHLENLVSRELTNPWWTKSTWEEALTLLQGPSAMYAKHVISAAYSFAWAITQYQNDWCPNGLSNCNDFLTTLDKAELAQQVKKAPEKMINTAYENFVQIGHPNITVSVINVKGSTLEKKQVGLFINGKLDHLNKDDLPSPGSGAGNCKTTIWTNKGYLAMVVIFPLLVLILVILLIVCIIRRNKQQKMNNSKTASASAYSDPSTDIYYLADRGVDNQAYSDADSRSTAGRRSVPNTPSPPPVPSLSHRPSLADILQREDSVGSLPPNAFPRSISGVDSVRSGSSSGTSSRSPTSHMTPPYHHQGSLGNNPHLSTFKGHNQGRSGSLPVQSNGRYGHGDDVRSMAPGGPPVYNPNLTHNHLVPQHLHVPSGGLITDNGVYLDMKRPFTQPADTYYPASTGSGSTDSAYQQRHLPHEDPYINSPKHDSHLNNQGGYSSAGSIGSSVQFANDSIVSNV